MLIHTFLLLLPNLRFSFSSSPLYDQIVFCQTKIVYSPSPSSTSSPKLPSPTNTNNSSFLNSPKSAPAISTSLQYHFTSPVDFETTIRTLSPDLILAEKLVISPCLVKQPHEFMVSSSRSLKGTRSSVGLALALHIPKSKPLFFMCRTFSRNWQRPNGSGQAEAILKQSFVSYIHFKVLLFRKYIFLLICKQRESG